MHLALRFWTTLILLVAANSLIAESSSSIHRLTADSKSLPTDRRSLTAFQREWLPRWQEMVQLKTIDQNVNARSVYLKTSADHTTEKLFLSRAGQNVSVAAWIISPLKKEQRCTVILADPNGPTAFLGTNSSPAGLARMFIDHNLEVMVVDLAPRGQFDTPSSSATNDILPHVQNLLMAVQHIKREQRGTKVILCGSGYATLWSFITAPAADGIIVDCEPFDAARLKAGISLDTLTTIGILSASNPFFVHNTKALSSNPFEPLNQLDVRNRPQFLSGQATAEQLAQWIRSLK